MPTSRDAGLPKPAFLITIDTEGDNLWARPRTVATENARFLPRFQQLCERHGLKPTYLTNFEMAVSPVFQGMAKDGLRRQTLEVGMHLHAWNSPPLRPLTADDMQFQPYLIEYPDEVIAEKVAFMTSLLEAEFGVRPISHRAGRWSMNSTYLRVLHEHGYRVDCSVTPYVSYQDHPGDPKGPGGTDYTTYPAEAYFLDLHDLRRAGASDFLEVPMTILPAHPRIDRALALLGRNGPLRRAFLRRERARPRWLRPRGWNRAEMLQVLETAQAEKRSYVEFMLHSSEFMPGGSPTFATAESVENLYADLEAVFSAAGRTFQGATLGEFYVTACERAGRVRTSRVPGPGGGVPSGAGRRAASG